MDSKEAKALTKALQDNTEALQQHTKIMQAVLKMSGKPQTGRLSQGAIPSQQIDPALKNIKNF